MQTTDCGIFQDFYKEFCHEFTTPDLNHRVLERSVRKIGKRRSSSSNVRVRQPIRDRKIAGENCARLPISGTDRSQITNLSLDTQILKGRTTWRNLPSIFLILHDFDYLPRFFSVSNLTENVA